MEASEKFMLTPFSSFRELKTRFYRRKNFYRLLGMNTNFSGASIFTINKPSTH